MKSFVQRAVTCWVSCSALCLALSCKKEEPAKPVEPAEQKQEVAAPDPSVELEKAAEKWIDQEFQPSTLTRDQQVAELKWFREAAKPYRGQTINVVSETIDTHVYESKTLAKAFEEITGITVKHDLIQEGDVIEKLQTQMQSGRSIYDMYVNDSDLIGTHMRYGFAVPLSDFMSGEGKDVTSPTLDVDDFIGKSFGTGPDGKL